MRDIIVIAHNIRSTHNVGAILRTCDGFGISKLVYSGYTPYPKLTEDSRLPHLSEKITRDIHKTALGAELTVKQDVVDELVAVINAYRKQGYRIVGLEQGDESVMLNSYPVPEKVVLILGEERYGLTPELVGLCDDLVEIPMIGKKESFNVSVATGICLYHLALAK